MTTAKSPTTLIRKVLYALYAVALVSIVLGVVIGPKSSSPNYARRSYIMQTSRSLALTLQQYAADHKGNYPDGNSSTEVFQKLIDGHYIDDPQILYIQVLGLPGKVEARDTHLKSENVCWDVTSPIDSSAPGSLPVVFVTGYRVTYSPGAAAIPLVTHPRRSWFQNLFGIPETRAYFAAANADASARAFDADSDGNIPGFIPATVDAKEKRYRQLTPDGIISR